MEPDEFIIDDLIGRRDITLPNGRTQRQYKVKWRGYPLAEATWQPKTGLMERKALADYVRDFDVRMDGPPPPVATEPSEPEPSMAPPTQGQSEATDSQVPAPETADSSTDDPIEPAPIDPDLPINAKLVRGVWHYQFQPTEETRLSRTGQARWYPASHFSEDDLLRYRVLHPAAPALPVQMGAYVSRPRLRSMRRRRQPRPPRRIPTFVSVPPPDCY